MADNYDSMQPGLNAPAVDGFTVTPHDANPLTRTPRALFIGTGGNLVVTTMKGTDITLKNIASGSIVSVRVNKVKATGTTATDIVGLD